MQRDATWPICTPCHLRLTACHLSYGYVLPKMAKKTPRKDHVSPRTWSLTRALDWKLADVYEVVGVWYITYFAAKWPNSPSIIKTHASITTTLKCKQGLCLIGFHAIFRYFEVLPITIKVTLGSNQCQIKSTMYLEPEGFSWFLLVILPPNFCFALYLLTNMYD